MAGGTGSLNPNYSGLLDNLAVPAAIRACFAFTSLGGAAAFAYVAQFVSLELDCLTNSLGSFLQSQRDTRTNVTPSASAASAPAASKEVAENIAKSRED